MPVRVRSAVPTWCLLACLTWSAPARASDDAPEWGLVSLPGGRAELLPRLGMTPDVPVALVAGEVIRVVYASREPDNDVLERVRRYFAAPPAGAELVPVPLPVARWRELLGERTTDATVFSEILQNRRAAMLCYGLLHLDRETLAAVAGDAALLRRLYERHAGVFAAFGDVLRVREGRLVLPGGDDHAATWAMLIGEPLTDPIRAIQALLDANDGRLLYFADALSGLDAERLRLVFQPPTTDETPFEQARSVYRAFTRIEPNWKLGDFPFVRLGADPALLLTMLRTNPESGRLRHTKAFWELVLGERRVPANSDRRWAELGDGDRAEPGWLLRRLSDALLPERVERLLIYAYAERLTDQLGGAPASEVAWLVRGYRRYPALLLMLERLGITDTAVLRRMVTQAGRVTAVADDAATLEIGLGLYQAPLMLIARARQSLALDDSGVRALVDSLSQIEPKRDGYGRAVARWFDTALLPALGHDPSAEGASPEATVLEAIAGLRAPASATTQGSVTWEAHPYRVDVAAPELARLTEARGLQAGNTLDAALALCRVGASVAQGNSLADARAAAAALGRVRALLAPIETSERTTAPAPIDLAARTEEASRDLALVRTRNDVKRLGDIAGLLARAEDAALADVLTSVLYAIWLGDPSGQPFLAGNVARRHDYGVRLMTGESRAETPWAVPIETSGDGEPWHLRGALLGLDVGLARLALRRTRFDRPDQQPTLNDSDRRTLMVGLALTGPTDLEPLAASNMASWLRRGRAVAGSPTQLSAAIGTLGLDGRRRQAIAWAAAHSPDEVASLLMRTELVLLGRPAGAEIPAAWGAADTPRSGCLCLQFPNPPAIQRFAGRAGAGLLTSRSADLKLRVLEELERRQLPASLTRGVLASALQDYLDEARPAHSDDWFTLARNVDRVTSDRFDDYIAALTAGGELVPMAPVANATGGHP